MKKNSLLKSSLFLCLIFGIVVTAHAATYSYDDINRLTSVDYENGQTITYTYDAGGNLLSVQSNSLQSGIAGSFAWQVPPESANLPQANVKVWTAGADRTTTEPLVDQLVDLNLEGKIELAGLQPGTYDVTLKFPYTLRVLAQNVVVNQGAMSNVDFGEVILGDTWGDNGPDNIIDASDYSAIIYSFGSVPGQDNFIDTCDLNRDGIIDVTDYSIVLYNFGQVGVEPF